MKIKFLSWNTYRKRLHTFAEPLLSFDADIIAVQEIKPPIKLMSDEIYEKLSEYQAIWNNVGRGEAILVRDLDIKELSIDFNGRVMTIDFDYFSFVNVCAPSLKIFGEEEYNDWHREYRRYLKRLKLSHPVIVGGTFNIRTNIDKIPPEEVDAMKNLKRIGFVDAFEKMNPNQENAYTYRPPKNSGEDFDRRNDYFFVSKAFSNNIISATIEPENFESNHRPIILEMEI